VSCQELPGSRLGFSHLLANKKMVYQFLVVVEGADASFCEGYPRGNREASRLTNALLQVTEREYVD